MRLIWLLPLVIACASANAQGTLRPDPKDGVRRPGEIRLGRCSNPELMALENGDHIYVVHCSSGAVIFLPKEIFERGDGPVDPTVPEVETHS